jgi:hypothetical protein
MATTEALMHKVEQVRADRGETGADRALEAIVRRYGLPRALEICEALNGRERWRARPPLRFTWDGGGVV